MKATSKTQQATYARALHAPPLLAFLLSFLALIYVLFESQDLLVRESLVRDNLVRKNLENLEFKNSRFSNFPLNT